MNPRSVLAIAASYWLVACLAWTYGYLCHAWIDSRNADSLPTGLDAHEVIVDLAENPQPAVPAYNWATDDSGLDGGQPAAGVFEWPGGITVVHRYRPETT